VTLAGDCGNTQLHDLSTHPAAASSWGSVGGSSNTLSPVENEGRVSAPSDFGTLLRRYRLASGLSQEALAERARMSTNGIGALERGDRRTPQRGTLSLLAHALNLSEEQRQALVAAAARTQLPRHGGGASLTIGPWAAAAASRLPLALTSFVGREAELDEIATLVRSHRMVTLTGAGGVGKTQTALHVAASLSNATDGAVCFIGFATIANPALVVATIASTLGVQEIPDHLLLETLISYLKNRSLLLIFDNCEHVITEAATVAGALLAACPNIRILATSREPLRAAGEYTYRLPSLSIPSSQPTHRFGVADAAAYAAMKLFTDRACAVDHRFTLTDENAPIVAELCRRLDGIPLAIELAAARVNQLPVKALAEKLDDRFRILTGGERTALPRQQTMRATIDWSYDLLAVSEQRVFERLSVFAGGCTLAAASGVCGSEEMAELDVFDVMSSLVDKSLLLVDLEGREPRYRLLESSREYAREKLVARGEQAIVAEDHARAFLDVAEQLDAAYDTAADLVWTEHAREELDNWRAALEWALAARGDVVLGQRLVGELCMVWSLLAPAEGRRWVALALDLDDDGTPAIVRASIGYAGAGIANKLDENELELSSSGRALALYRDLGDEVRAVIMQSYLGHALVRLGRSQEAEPMLREAVAHARRLDVRKHLAFLLRTTAFALLVNGDFSAARGHTNEAILILKAIGADRVAALAIAIDLAEVEFYAGNAELALRHASGALPTLRAFNDTPSVLDALNLMSACLISLDRYDEAEKHARESLVLSNELHSSAHVARAVHRLAVVVALQAQGNPGRPQKPYARAARLIGFVDARLADVGSPRTPADQREYDRALAILRGAMGSDELASFINAGAAMSEEQAVDEALMEA
jgi:predicted ATPase/DNA-binding XRE family transcriptional regulator